MREFSSAEQEIINKIISGPETQFRQLFSTRFNTNARIDIDNQGRIEIWTSDKIDWKEVVMELNVVVNLLAYLLNQRLIYAYSNGVVIPVYSATLGDFKGTGRSTISLPYNSKLLGRVTIRHISNLFNAYEPIRILARNKFVLKEDRRHSQILWATWAAIFVALAMSTLSLIMQYQTKANDIIKLQQDVARLENKMRIIDNDGKQNEAGSKVSGSKPLAEEEFYLRPIVKPATDVPDRVEGEFIRGFGIDKRDRYYTFSNADFPITYYLPFNGCGYFKLFGRNYTIENRFNIENFGCEMDELTFKVYHLSVATRNYFLVTSIAESNGRGTRDVFCELFDTTDPKGILFYPLWSLYGSHYYFGDYNGDGKLDFLEVRYDRTKLSDNDTFKIQLQTLANDRKTFADVVGKYIIFHQDFISNSFKLTTLENHW